MYRLPEVPIEDISVDEVELVNQALHHPEVNYRTISGIEKDTSMEPARIASVLQNTDIARGTIYTRNGETVFAASDYPKPRREKIATFLIILAHSNRPIELNG